MLRSAANARIRRSALRQSWPSKIIGIYAMPDAYPMKGDLSTLRKVCLYGSKVMSAGIVVIAAVTAGLLAIGAGSVFSDRIHDVLIGIVGSDGSCAAAFAELLSILVLALATVSAVRAVMASICSEHSPFTEENTDTMIRLSKMYLGGAVILAALQWISAGDLAATAFMFFGCILLSVVLYMFALMVRYGSVLQDESDHTL